MSTILPSTDLAVEVENTQGGLNRMRIYAAQKTSKYLPTQALQPMIEAISNYRETEETAWIKDFRRWVA